MRVAGSRPAAHVQTPLQRTTMQLTRVVGTKKNRPHGVDAIEILDMLQNVSCL